eukprot:1299437-Pyramimonas_sp.AAC.1
MEWTGTERNGQDWNGMEWLAPPPEPRCGASPRAQPPLYTPTPQSRQRRPPQLWRVAAGASA